MPQNRETKYNRITVCGTISWLYYDSELFTRNRTRDNLFISFWILFTVQEIFRNNNSNYKLKTVRIILLWTYLLISSRDTCIYRAWITNFFNIHVTLDITSVIFFVFVYLNRHKIVLLLFWLYETRHDTTSNDYHLFSVLIFYVQLEIPQSWTNKHVLFFAAASPIQ